MLQLVNTLNSDKLIELSEQLFTRELTDLSPASKWQQYDMVTLKNNERIYIHQITQPPSYHHIMFVNLNGACLQKFRTSTEVPSAGELNYKFSILIKKLNTMAEP